MMGDVILIAFFLLFILVVGSSVGRKVENFKDYAVGQKHFSTWALAGSVVATNLGGGSLSRGLSLYYANGFYAMLGSLIIWRFLVIGQFFGVRMGEFLNHFSIAESMGSLYGRTVRIITALSGFVKCTAGIAAEVYVMTRVIHILYPTMRGAWLAIFATAIVVAYCALGGARPVIVTDLIQVLLFGLLLPIMLVTMFHGMDDTTHIMDRLASNPNFNLKYVVSHPPAWLDIILISLAWPIPRMGPACTQRIYMSNHVKQIKGVFLKATQATFVLRCLMAMIAMMVWLQNPSLNPHDVLGYLVNQSYFAILKPLLCMGVLALSMSTADSHLHAATVLIVHDVMDPIKKVKNKVLWARRMTILIGAVACYVAIHSKGIFHILYRSLNFYIPIVTIPFVTSIMGFRPHRRSILISMATGTLAAVVANQCMKATSFLLLPGMLANFLGLFGSHYLLPGSHHTGWIGVKERAPLLVQKQAYARKWRKWKAVLKHFSLQRYLKDLFPTQSSSFFLVGLYADAMIILALLSMPAIPGIFGPFVACMMSLATVLLLYPCLQHKSTGELATWIYDAFPVVVCLLLGLTGAMMMRISHYAIIPTMIFCMNIAYIIQLFGLWLGGMMCVLSLLLAHMMVPYADYAPLLLQLGTSGSLLVCLSMVTVIGFILIKQRNKRLFLANIDCMQKYFFEKREEVLAIQHYQEELDRLTKGHMDQEDLLPMITHDLQEAMQPQSEHKREEIIAHALDRLEGYKEFIKERFYMDRYYLPLHVQNNVSLHGLLDASIEKFTSMGIGLDMAIYSDVDPLSLTCDPKQIQHLVHYTVRSMEELHQADEKGIIHLYLHLTKIRYSVHKETDAFQLLPAVSLLFSMQNISPVIQESYHEKLDDMVLKGVKDHHGYYGMEIMRIVAAHYGCYVVAQNTDVSTMHIVLPIALNQVRDRVMNGSVPLGDQDACTTASFAQEKALEELLVEKTSLDRSMIQSTIQYIRKCHGNQKRASGEPFYTHPMAVAEILVQVTQDPDAILAALLHDVVEDSKVTLSYVRSRFGSGVASIVNHVTHMGDSCFKKKLTQVTGIMQFKNLKDRRALQVKLADRLHNVRILGYCPAAKQVKVAKDTLQFYIPLARSMGIDACIAELQQRCEAILRDHA